MYLYSNAARCACNAAAKEFTLQLLQNSPSYDADGTLLDVMEQEVLASVVMPPEYARQLAQMIIKSIDDSFGTPPESAE